MLRETRLLFSSVMRDRSPLVELLDARYTFVNEHLARHYGIAGVKGSHMRRVELADGPRRGLLGPGQHPHAHLAAGPHLAGGARQVGDGEA